MNKAPYAKPALRSHGEVRSLTLGNNGSLNDNKNATKNAGSKND